MLGEAGGRIDGTYPGARWHDADSVLRNVPDLVTVVNEIGVIEYVSPSARELLGLTAEQLVGRRVCEFLDADGRRNCAAWMAYAHRGADLPELAHHVIRADGTLASFESRIRRLRDRAGSSGLVAVSRDVSVRAAVEQQTADRAHVWSEVIDLVPEGLLVLDRNGIVVAANRAAAELLRVELADLCGSPARRHLTSSADGAGEPGTLIAGQLRLCAGREFAVTAYRSGRPATLRGRAAALPAPRRSGGTARIALMLEEVGRPESVRESDAVAGGGEVLSPREVAVLRLLAEGRDVRAIATELGISIHTVRAYVKSILRKLDVRTQLQAVVVSARAGVLDLS